MFTYILDMDYENNLSYNIPVRETQYQVIQNISYQVRSLLSWKLYLIPSSLFTMNVETAKWEEKRKTNTSMYVYFKNYVRTMKIYIIIICLSLDFTMLFWYINFIPISLFYIPSVIKCIKEKQRAESVINATVCLQYIYLYIHFVSYLLLVSD